MKREKIEIFISEENYFPENYQGSERLFAVLSAKYFTTLICFLNDFLNEQTDPMIRIFNQL